MPGTEAFSAVLAESSIHERPTTNRSRIVRGDGDSPVTVVAVDALTMRADDAARRAADAYRNLERSHEDFLEFERSKRVSRQRFSVLVDRIRATGSPYGAHSIVYRDDGQLLLVRHAGIDLWVLPGGGIDDGETFHEAACRELDEEAGVEVSWDGLGYVTRITITTDGYRTWGLLPVFAARAESLETTIDDPDAEIVDAGWFADLPADTRDRDLLREWRATTLE